TRCRASCACDRSTCMSSGPWTVRASAYGVSRPSPRGSPFMGTRRKQPAALRVVGKAIRKLDATAKVTGVTRFADDLFLPRMLYARLLRSPHPHARITGIDTSKAQALPGVKAVLTGRDLPIAFGILPVSQDDPALAIDKVRFVGDPVAGVAAVSEEIATAAPDPSEVRSESLRPITG